MKLGIIGHGKDKFTPEGMKLAIALMYKIISHRKVDVGISGHSPMGGIDIEFENVCNKLNIPLDLKIPKQHRWNAEYGYKQRNIDIAKDSDELHIIVVDKYPPNYKGMVFSKCYHCGTTNHVKSGACWTGKLAQRLGKKVEWHIIKNMEVSYEIKMH